MSDKSGKISVKIIGVGGAGINALNRIMESGLSGVEFIVADFDPSALERSNASVKLKLGSLYSGLTFHEFSNLIRVRKNGLALAEEKELRQAIGSPDAVIIVGGLGGATGSKAIPIIAELAKEAGALTLAVVTLPFAFEDPERLATAKEDLNNLHHYVDTVITIPDEGILKMAHKKEITTAKVFQLSDNILLRVVQCLLGTMSLQCLGRLHLDDWSLSHFEPVVRAKNGAPLAGRVGIGTARGKNRVKEATRMALTSPLLEGPREMAGGVLIWLFCAPDVTTQGEVIDTVNTLGAAFQPTADVRWGITDDYSLKGELYITVICLYEQHELKIAV